MALFLGLALPKSTGCPLLYSVSNSRDERCETYRRCLKRCLALNTIYLEKDDGFPKNRGAVWESHNVHINSP